MQLRRLAGETEVESFESWRYPACRLRPMYLSVCAQANQARLAIGNATKIEHRMFSHIPQNCRGRPLISHEVIVDPIADTTTQAGL
jgi:hypothetical protein